MSELEKERSVSNLNMASYSMAEFIFMIFSGIFGSFFIFYWETEVGLNIWIVTLGYIIYAIWNSINDPLVGYFTDKPNKLWKKYGKRFPFIIIGGIPSIFMLALIFTPPYLDPITGAWIYFGWILLSSCMYELFYTIFQLSNAALFPDKFRSDNERRKAGFFRMGLGLVGTAVGLIIPPLFISYGDRQSYTNMAWIFVVLNLVFFLTIIPGHRESAQMRERYMQEPSAEKKLPFLKTMKIVVTQKNFIVYMIVFLFDGIIGACLLGSIQYATKYILLEDPAMSIIVLAGFLLGSLGSIFFWLIFSQKLNNNRKMLIIGVFLNTIFLFPFMFVQGLLGFVIAAVILGIGGGALRIGRSPVLGDTIDEATVKSGQRLEGSYMGVYAFFVRFGLIGQILIFAIVHELTGFNADVLIQTELALFGIRAHLALIPMILTLIGLVIFIFVYDLTPERTKEIKEKLKELNL